MTVSSLRPKGHGAIYGAGFGKKEVVCVSRGGEKRYELITDGRRTGETISPHAAAIFLDQTEE